MVRAFEIGTPPEDNTGNNEFGMGMKVAACWYAKIGLLKLNVPGRIFLKE